MRTTNIGDSVRIMAGPYAGQSGSVVEIHPGSMGENDPGLEVKIFALIDGSMFNRTVRLPESMTVPIDVLNTATITMQTGDIVVDRRDVGQINFGEVKSINRTEGLCVISTITTRTDSADLLTTVRLNDLGEAELLSKLQTVQVYIERGKMLERAIKEAIAEKERINSITSEE